MNLELSQSALLLSNRMRLSTLIGAGLVHDLNNALAVVLASAEALRDPGLTSRHATECSEDIQAAARHAASLTARLMRFVRSEDWDSSACVDVRDIVARTETFLRVLAGPAVALHVTLGPEPLVARCASSRVEHVLYNLVANARDAISEEGRIDVRLERHKDGGISLSVVDSGAGISQEVEERLFEPFFTTRADRGGTGLGLASVRALAEEDGGVVSFRSEAGHGATFVVTWPVAPAAAIPEVGACGELVPVREAVSPPASHARLRSACPEAMPGRPTRSDGQEGRDRRMGGDAR